jgi:hypothetical protein
LRYSLRLAQETDLQRPARARKIEAQDETPSFAGKMWKHLPTGAAFLLLALQMAVPWTVATFITEDGPSHLYGATLARELLIKRYVIYSSVYTIQRTALPNWMTTIVLGVIQAVTGNQHAEQLFASLTILIGFLGLTYVIRSLAPELSPWTPVTNVLLQTWFLWVGFYNFYLGMVLLPFLIGYYIRSIGRLNLFRATVIGTGLVLLFFTHLIAVAFTLMALAAVAVWLNIAVPVATGARGRFFVPSPALRELRALFLATVPTLVLLAIYAYGVKGTVSSGSPPFMPGLKDFPMQTFITGAGRLGRQIYLWPPLLCYIVAGFLLMRKEEWRSARGGLVIATIIAFAAYLLVPDKGFGGSAATVRFAWGVFLLGGMMAPSVSRLWFIRLPFALYITVLLLGNTVATAQAARSMSNAAEPYLATARRIPSNSTIVRLYYPAPGAAAQYGYEGLIREPFFHLDSLAAVRSHSLDLTDYEPLTELFPVVLQKEAQGQRYQLWGFEGADSGSVVLLKWVRENFPAPVDFVFVFGDEHSPEAAARDMPAMLSYLDSDMQLMAVSPNSLLRIYHRRRFHPR